MEYIKSVFVVNMLNEAESIACKMLCYDEESSSYKFVTPFNIHLFSLCLGVSQILSLDTNSYLHLGQDIRRVMLGYNLSRESVSAYWESSIFRGYRDALDRIINSKHKGAFGGIFEFIDRFKELVKDDASITFVGATNDEVLYLWEELSIVISDDISRILIGQHLNALLKENATFMDIARESILMYCIDSQMGYIADTYKDITQRILMPPDEAVKFNDLWKHFVTFLMQNPKAKFTDNVVPKESENILKRVLADGSPNEIPMEEGVDIPDELKKGIRDYLKSGGKPGTLMGYINMIC